MSFVKVFTESQLVQESTIHGISQLRFSRSKYRFTFWLTITLAATVYAGYEISKEIRHISSDVEFEVIHRLANIQEIVLPSMGYCFSNPLDIFDWTVIHNLMVESSWTEEDVGHLLTTYEQFDSLDFKFRNASMEHVKKLGNITQTVFESMLRRICQNMDGIGYQPPNVWRTGLQPLVLCLLIDCQLKKHQKGNKLFLVRAKSNNLTKQASNLRMNVINFMQAFQSVDLHTDRQDYLFSRDSYPETTLLEMNAYNAYMIYPEMSNSPTMSAFLCPDNPLAEDNMRIPGVRRLEHYSFKTGIDCFQWSYKIQQLADARITRYRLQKEQTTVLALFYLDYKQWRVQEYKPKFLWYQLVSNIGGTLSIWTGASILSFLHLIEVLIYSCCKRSYELNSRHIQPIG